MAVDLLRVGEELAELDLVVRQLDDGTLTVARDDSLPDEARVQVRAEEGAVVATVVVAQVAERSAAVDEALAKMNRPGVRGTYSWEAGKLRYRIALATEGDQVPERDALRGLFDGVVAGAEAQRALLAKLAGVTPVAPPPRDPTRKFEPATLPSSYLPGVGQLGGQTTTQRYGAAGAVPGRPDLAPEEKRGASQRVPASRPGGGGGGGGLIVVGMLVILAVAGGGFMLAQSGRPKPPEGPGVAALPTEAGAPTTVPPGTAAAPPTATAAAPGPRSTEAAPKATEAPPPPPKTLTEEEALKAAREAKEPPARLAAVDAWRSAGLDRSDGARGRMVEALGEAAASDAKVDRHLEGSLRAHPALVDEVAALFGRVGPLARRALIEQLASAPAGAEAEAAAKVLAANVASDTKELAIEEALARLGKPREGAAARLVSARGAEWALWGEGQALLEQMAKADVKSVGGLLGHADLEVKKLACSLIAKSEQPREALALLTPALKDPDQGVRERVVEALALLRDPRSSWPLARGLLREESRQVKDLMRGAIQKLPVKETAQLLEQLLRQQQPADRRAAILGLVALGKAESVPPLHAALKDPDREVRLEAIKALDVLHGLPELKSKVAEGLAAIRELGLDKSDRDIHTVARKLHMAITGRMPEQGR